MGVMWIWNDSLKATVPAVKGASGLGQTQQNTFRRSASFCKISGCYFFFLQHLILLSADTVFFCKQEKAFLPKVMQNKKARN